ncbi:MAG TPA: methyltransferase domain-containing protein [Nitrospirae bacterium]|nr:methyltransferase domain-containing protein [Nitrospirota bacterium]
MTKGDHIGRVAQTRASNVLYGSAVITTKDKGKIATSINGKYRKVAQNPEGLFKYPTGKAGLDALQYDPELVRLLPDSIAESYCGPGNPFSMGAINKGESVLDIGCGAGVDTILAGMMAGTDGYVTGLEIVPEMLQRAQNNLRELDVSHVSLLEASAEQLPLPDKSFDVVISNGVFNLVVDKVKALKEVFRVLKPGGRFQIADQIRTGEMPKETSSIVKSWGR